MTLTEETVMASRTADGTVVAPGRPGSLTQVEERYCNGKARSGA